MCSSLSPRVTFDTNVCDIINNPDKWPTIMAPADARHLRQAIGDGKIQAFVSAATLFVECLNFEDKLTYLSVAGTQNPRPKPDPRRTAVFSDLGALGFKALHAPLIGAEIFIDGLDWADDVVHSSTERHRRFCAFGRGYPRHEPIRAIGLQFLAKQPPVPDGRRIQTGPTSWTIENSSRLGDCDQTRMGRAGRGRTQSFTQEDCRPLNWRMVRYADRRFPRRIRERCLLHRR